MATKITREVLEGYLECRYKGRLRLDGEEGERSDYERMTSEEEAEARTRGLTHLLSCHPEGEACRGATLTAARPEPGASGLPRRDPRGRVRRPCGSTGSSGWRGRHGLVTSTTPRSSMSQASPSGGRRGTCWPSWDWSWGPSRGGSPPPGS